MKLASLLALSCLFSASLFAAPKPSLISAFAGSFSGTGLITAAPNSYPGTASASFKTSKNKEVGKLTIVGTFAPSGSALVATHIIFINKRKFSEIIAAGGQTLSASGGAMVKERVISFSGSGVADSTSYRDNGSIRLTKKGLIVTETISLTGLVETFTYTMKAKHKTK